MIDHATRHNFPVLLVSAVVLGVACGSSDETPAEDHTPVRFEMSVNGVAMTDTLRLTAGGVDTVRFTFYNAEDDNLDDHEADHYSGLEFPGGVNATATTELDAHFTQVVVNTEGAGSAGVATVKYGHDAAADENSFPAPFKFE